MWCLQIWGVNTLSCLQYKNIIVYKNQSIPYFPPHCGIQCSIPSKECPFRKRLPLSCHKNSSQIFDATKLWKHTIPLTYNTKTLISNISETHRFSPQIRLIPYPDHKTTLIHLLRNISTFLNISTVWALYMCFGRVFPSFGPKHENDICKQHTVSSRYNKMRWRYRCRWSDQTDPPLTHA